MARSSKGNREAETAVYDVVDGARYIGVSPTTFRRLIWAGALPAIRIGRSVRVMRLDLIRFLEAHRHVGRIG